MTNLSQRPHNHKKKKHDTGKDKEFGPFCNIFTIEQKEEDRFKQYLKCMCACICLCAGCVCVCVINQQVIAYGNKERNIQDT